MLFAAQTTTFSPVAPTVSPRVTSLHTGSSRQQACCVWREEGGAGERTPDQLGFGTVRKATEVVHPGSVQAAPCLGRGAGGGGGAAVARAARVGHVERVTQPVVAAAAEAQVPWE